MDKRFLWEGIILIVLILFFIFLPPKKIASWLSGLFKKCWTWFIGWIKKKLVALLKRGIALFHRVLIKARLIGEPENQLGLNDLAPSDNAEHATIYLQSLKWGIDNPKVRNIALTGTYGSGKSSILGTFQKGHLENSYLNISLANFVEVPEETVPTPKPKRSEKEQEESHTSKQQRLIETSILQQMFYKVKGTKIPDSRFNRIKRLSGKIIAFRLLVLIATCFALTILIKPTVFDKIAWAKYWLAAHNEEVIYFSVGILVLTVCLIAGYIFRNLNHLRFNKLNVVQGELEIERQSEFSILNNYLEEIIYFFEATDFNVVVLEDLDRFERTDIFTKLRELNILLNNAEQIGRRIVFIYAIKDDVFVDKTRTKFFDLVVPVIPILNSTNSLKKLKDMLEAAGAKDDISEDLVADITLYIDDMRISKNIVNEYAIYKKNLISVEFKRDQLFSMIVYKNIYPNDFAKLEESKGVLHDVFARRRELDDILIDQKEKRLGEIDTILENEPALATRSTEELRLLYSMAIVLSIRSFQGITINGSRKTIKQLTEKENFDWVIQQKNLTVFFSTQNGYGEQSQSVPFNFKEIEASIDPVNTYIERLVAVDQISEDNIEKFQQEHSNLTEEINEIRHARMERLMEINPDILDHYGDLLKDKELLVYLLRHGYINDMYATLISYFYEGEMKRGDFAYLRKVKDRIQVPPDYELVLVNGILKRLSAREMLSPLLLNISMMNYLLEHKYAYEEKFSSYASMFKEPNRVTIDFIHLYVNTGSQVGLFFSEVLSKWYGMWTHVDGNKSLSKEQKEKYLVLMLVNMSNGQIQKIMSAEQFDTAFRMNWPLVTKTDPGSLTKLNKLFTDQKTEFFGLTGGEYREDLLNMAFEGSMYEVSTANLEFMMKYKLGDTFDKEKFDHSNYSYIKSTGMTSLEGHIESDIEFYLTEVLLALPSPCNEDEEFIVELLNSAEIKDEIKEGLIKKSTTELSSLEEIATKKLWTPIVEKGSLVFSAENIETYFDEYKLDAALVNYINKKLPNDYTAYALIISDETTVVFKEALLSEDSIHDDVYIKITESLEGSFDALPLEDLSSKKITGLLIKKLVNLSVVYFEQLKSNHRPFHLRLLELDKTIYLAEIDKYDLDATDVILLISSNEFAKPEKIQIVQVFLARNPAFDQEVHSSIIKTILSGSPISVPLPLIQWIADSQMSREPFTRILTQQLDFHSVNDILPLIYKIPFLDKLDTKKKKVIIPNQQEFQELCLKLKAKGFLSSALPDNYDLVVWIKRPR